MEWGRTTHDLHRTHGLMGCPARLWTRTASEQSPLARVAGSLVVFPLLAFALARQGQNADLPTISAGGQGAEPWQELGDLLPWCDAVHGSLQARISARFDDFLRLWRKRKMRSFAMRDLSYCARAV